MSVLGLMNYYKQYCTQEFVFLCVQTFYCGLESISLITINYLPSTYVNTGAILQYINLCVLGWPYKI
jgi:hypothetical protein